MRLPHRRGPFEITTQRAVVAITSPRAFILKHTALFAAAALFVFVLSLTYGLDLSPGFF